jgi:hypothetical protein
VWYCSGCCNWYVAGGWRYEVEWRRVLGFRIRLSLLVVPRCCCCCSKLSCLWQTLCLAAVHSTSWHRYPCVLAWHVFSRSACCNVCMTLVRCSCRSAIQPTRFSPASLPGVTLCTMWWCQQYIGSDPALVCVVGPWGVSVCAGYVCPGPPESPCDKPQCCILLLALSNYEAVKLNGSTPAKSVTRSHFS